MLACIAAAIGNSPARSVPVVPPGYEIQQVATFLASPVAMAFTPDGRLLFTEKTTGRVRMIKDRVMLDKPVLDLAVNYCGERGCLGICIDPHFAANGWFYVFYTPSTTNDDTPIMDRVRENRVARFTLDGDTALAGSEVVLRTFPIPGNTCNHYGSNLHFAPDDTLIVSQGDINLTPNPCLDLTINRGKILRLDPSTGDAAPGNYFARDGDPNTLPEIYAYGLRNSFDFTFHPRTGRIFATENGEAREDEINIIVDGGNYGFPKVEGPADLPAEQDYAAAHPDYHDPIWSSGDTTQCPTGILVVDSARWSGQIGSCLMFGECNPSSDGTRRIRCIPLGGAMGDSILGPPGLFATGFGLITDLAYDGEQWLYVCTWYTIWRIRPIPAVSVETAGNPALLLEHARGNPERGSAALRFRLPEHGRARLRLFDSRGRRIRTLVDEELLGGWHWALWDGRSDGGERVPAGVYWATVERGSQARTLKLVLLP